MGEPRGLRASPPSGLLPVSESSRLPLCLFLSVSIYSFPSGLLLTVSPCLCLYLFCSVSDFVSLFVCLFLSPAPPTPTAASPSWLSASPCAEYVFPELALSRRQMALKTGVGARAGTAPRSTGCPFPQPILSCSITFILQLPLPQRFFLGEGAGRFSGDQ